MVTTSPLFSFTLPSLPSLTIPSFPPSFSLSSFFTWLSFSYLLSWCLGCLREDKYRKTNEVKGQGYCKQFLHNYLKFPIIKNSIEILLLLRRISEVKIKSLQLISTYRCRRFTCVHGIFSWSLVEKSVVRLSVDEKRIVRLVPMFHYWETYLKSPSSSKTPTTSLLFSSR